MIIHDKYRILEMKITFEKLSVFKVVQFQFQGNTAIHASRKYFLHHVTSEKLVFSLENAVNSNIEQFFPQVNPP